MKYFKYYFICLLVFITVNSISAQEKKPITHNDYAKWKSISEFNISNNGKFIYYVIKPQEGDGYLYIENLKTKVRDSIQRAYDAKFSPNSNFLVFKIKPQFDTIRAAKLKKIKDDNLPKDSIGIWNLETSDITKYARIKSFQIAKKESDFTALLFEKEESIKKDSLQQTDSIASKKKKQDVHKLMLINPISNFSREFEKVKKYSLSENGKTCAFTQIAQDSIDSVTINIFNTQKHKSQLLFTAEGSSENITVDNSGEQIAFTYSADTIKSKSFGLFYWSETLKDVIDISGVNFNKLPENNSISTDGKIYFNESGSELYFGIRKKPEAEIKDTLTKDEKVSVDIWNWKDPLLQTQQLKELEKEKKRNFTTVYYPKINKLVYLGNDSLRNIRIDKKATGSISLAYDNLKYQKESTWDGSAYNDYYLMDRTTGNTKLFLEKAGSNASLSPKQNYVSWYNIADSSWYIYDIKNEKSQNISSGLDVNFYYELNDMPNEAPAYGLTGWTEDGYLILNDKFDLWKFDPKGKRKPSNITKGFGRENNIRLRYVKLDKEERFLASKMLLSAFELKTKKAGFYSLDKKMNLKQLIWADKKFNTPKKAKNADILMWRKESFVDYPELYISKTDFNKIDKITYTNPQQKEYNWGTNELVSWQTYDGDSMQGILYKPENFDPQKKYPMLVYFYERSSDRLHRHIVPAPIRSVINFTYYTSNEYLIFIPDIKYKTGYPGPSAYNCIVSGTEAMIKQFDFIDSKNIGLQGQSWGGYQIAYLITQTDIYKAAMAGAPVSNMTSAYGGIRWESGRSRAFQYEETQSRIGGTLWEKQDLYVLNSPLFFVPKINTPLLMMHNDKDGAVPWYQGIEMFNAMRRLSKPVWMLVYNGAPHNLKRRADMKDLTVRMQQFFDYYLKDAPEPKWMKTGVPAIDKGKEFGFELEE